MNPDVTGCGEKIFGVKPRGNHGISACNPVKVFGCGEKIFGDAICINPSLFYSAEITEGCPPGSVGGPFFSAPGQFISSISQADADAQAQVYIDNLIASQCKGVVSSFILEMLGPADDDIRLKINGSVPAQGSPATIFYWDYSINNWSTNWTSTQNPTVIPSGPTVFPVISTDRKWNALWYAGPTYETHNFIKMKYTGVLNVGDVVTVETMDGWQTQYLLSPWQATVTYFDGTSHVLTGGSSFTGVSPNTPSPPRYNPASAPPYDSATDLAAFLGLPDYRSQSYPNSGSFFTDYYANGSFTIPSL